MTEAPKRIWLDGDTEAGDCPHVRPPFEDRKYVSEPALEYILISEVQRLVAEARAEAFEEAANVILSDNEKDEPGYKIWDDERPRICEESAYRRIVALSDAPPRQPEFSVMRHKTGNAVAVCGICDIADCKHIREKKAAELIELALNKDHPLIDPPRQVTPQEAAKVLLEAGALTAQAVEAAHQQIDWCRNDQHTHTSDHPSQRPGTSCAEDIQDAWIAALRALANGGDD